MVLIPIRNEPQGLVAAIANQESDYVHYSLVQRRYQLLPASGYDMLLQLCVLRVLQQGYHN